MNIKEHYKEIFDKMLAEHIAQTSLREQELKIKQIAAEKLELEDKQGKPDAKKIKGGILKKAILIELENKNSLADDLDLQDKYYGLIKNKDIKGSEINKYGILTDELKNVKSEMSELKKRVLSQIDAVELAIITEIAREEINRLNNVENSKKQLSPEQLEAYIEKKKKITKEVKS